MMRIFLAGLAFNFDADFHELEEITKGLCFKSKWRHHRWDALFAEIQATLWKYSKKFSIAVIVFFGVDDALSPHEWERNQLTNLHLHLLAINFQEGTGC